MLKIKGLNHLHIVRRLKVSKKEKVIIKVSSILVAFLLCGLVCTLFASNSFFGFFEQVFTGSFTSTKQFVFLLEEIALLLGISLALLPAFKMHYWNLGAEGQIMIGGFGAGVISKFVGPYVSNGVCILLMFITAVVFGAIWGLIPAIFRARFKTNETLFTLMFNYIAAGILAFFIQKWDPAHGLMTGLTHGMFPLIFNQRYIITIIIVAVLTVSTFVYIKKSKHGYELSVVGENINTARYIGIDVKKVVLRTAILSGAICGLIGLLIVGYSGSVAPNLAEGRGFTAVLIVWLGHFNIGEIALSAFLVGFLTKGASRAQTLYSLGSSFPAVCMGVFFFVILVGEFFANYKIVMTKEVEDNDQPIVETKQNKEEKVNG